MIEEKYTEKQNSSTISKTVFIPPRKRQYVKKLSNVSQNYVDHIVPQGGLSTPNAQDGGDSKSIDNQIDQDDNNEYDEKTELQEFCTTGAQRNRSNFTVTPSSQSECSLDRQSNKSCDFFTAQPSKKRVNIKKPTTPNYEGLESGETSIFNPDYDEEETKSNYLTMTGTIKRGKKKGQSIDVQLNISREELEKINSMTLAATEKINNKTVCCSCSPSVGIHVFLFSLICLPFVTLYTGIYSFYIGTLTWYNMFIYFNEEKSCFCQLLMSPVLILTYPIAIVLCTIGLAIYAGIIQISCQFSKWLNEINDIEKGFYGWLCSFLRLSDCSPYEVVILVDFRPTDNQLTRPNSSTEELSL